MKTPIFLRPAADAARAPYPDAERQEQALEGKMVDHSGINLGEGSLNERDVGSRDKKSGGDRSPPTGPPPPRPGSPHFEVTRMDKSRHIIQLRPALNRLGNDWELLQDMARFFLEDAPMLVEKTDAAITSGNAAEVEWAAHSLKGLASHFDAAPLQTAAQEVESAGRARNLASLKDSAAELKVLVDQVCTELETSVLHSESQPDDIDSP